MLKRKTTIQSYCNCFNPGNKLFIYKRNSLVRTVDPRTAFWNSLQRGRSPSSALGTSSTRRIPETEGGGASETIFLSAPEAVKGHHRSRPTCPVCSVSSLLIKYIKKNLTEEEHVNLFTFSHCKTCHQESWSSHVIGQVVFVQGVGLKAVRRRVKVVASDATYETFSLRETKWGSQGHIAREQRRNTRM